MARGTQFSVLVSRLRSELKRSNDVAVGVDDVPSLKETLNHVYSILYLQRDWSHLRKLFSKPLTAGTRYYNLPSGLNTERIEVAAVYWGNLPTEIHRGIGFSEYAAFDSDEDERSDPVQKYDIRWTGTTQIEVWPIPATNDQTLKFIGIQDAPRLVNDTDQCLLDDTLVVLAAAAELIRDGEEKKIKQALANQHLNMLTARQRGDGGYRLGLGPTSGSVRPHEAVVRVS